MSLEYMRRYAAHYFAVVVATLVAGAAEFLPPRTWRGSFDRRDHRISHSFVAHEVVGNRFCLLISAGVPLALIAAYCTLARDALRRRLLPRPDGISKELHLLHASGLALALALAIAAAVTCALKYVIGNPRPDFVARCELAPTGVPRFSLADCSQQDRYLLLDGLRSTPSGHATLTTAGLAFTSAWQDRFTTGSRVRHYWLPSLVIVVMVSRVLDHKHFWYDVVGGCALGLVCAAVGWHVLTANERMSHTLPAPQL